MYLSRLVLDSRSRAVRRDTSDCQQMHRTVMGGFPEHGHRSRSHFGVLHRLDQSGSVGAITLLVQSSVAPNWSNLPKGYSLGIACKNVATAVGSIDCGMSLRFRLLANVTKKVQSENVNGRRVALNSDQERMVWLQRHVESGGCELVELICGGLPDVLSHTAGAGRIYGWHPDGRMSFAAVLFEGRLRVVDPERFRTMLCLGVGSAKAYGFGLLSVARG